MAVNPKRELADSRQIAECVPARGAKSMQVNYKYIKALIETLTREEVAHPYPFFQLMRNQEAALRAVIAEDDKTRWKRIGQIVGKSEVTVRNKAKEWGLTK
jgi:hypothetical protein